MQCSGGTVFGVIALQLTDHQYASLMFALLFSGFLPLFKNMLHQVHSKHL